MVVGDITIEDLLDIEFRSEGGALISTLLHRLYNEYGELPSVYNRFLQNLSKNTPVSGFLQVTSKEPLKVLKEFCKRKLNLCSVEHLPSIKLLRKELPPLWDMLMNIINIENSNYLPEDVSNIVLKLISIRKNTYKSSANRSSSD